jgi:capsular exopolysaccharide synthesis family protein
MSKDNYKSIFSTYDPESSVGTEFRRLLFNMTNNRILENGGKSFLITSPSTGEGKSTVASFLALTGAVHKPRKTLLIDADLRRPVIHKMFGLKQKNGLTDIIVGGAKLEDCAKSTEVPNLHVITSGISDWNPTELFDSPAIPGLFEAAKFYYDLIIVDSAPVIPVTDPLIIGTEVDGLCLVVKAGATQKEVVARACELINESGARLLGVVLNNVKQALPYYYNHRYYGYHYTSRNKHA